MSFDLFLDRFDAGPLTPQERAAVLAVVRRSATGPSDNYGFYGVRFPDGSSVELSARGLENDGDVRHCAFHLHDFTPDVVAFAWDVACAGSFALTNPQARNTPESPMVILTAPSQRACLPASMAGSAADCESAEQLGRLLGLSIDGWQAWRDKVPTIATSAGATVIEPGHPPPVQRRPDA